jgi:hypothetical protein
MIGRDKPVYDEGNTFQGAKAKYCVAADGPIKLSDEQLATQYQKISTVLRGGLFILPPVDSIASPKLINQ